ncbi:transposase, partial [Pyrococcus kukulkanii]
MRVKLTRTVVLESYPPTKKKFEAVKEVYTDYSGLLLILTESAFENKIRNPVKLRSSIPPELKVKYELPSHYYYTACQDVVARVKGFLEKKRKG